MATPFHRPCPWCTDSYPSAEKVSAGKASSASFVSCRHNTSGSHSAIHASTRSSRADNEFTFQVATRTACEPTRAYVASVVLDVTCWSGRLAAVLAGRSTPATPTRGSKMPSTRRFGWTASPSTIPTSWMTS